MLAVCTTFPDNCWKVYAEQMLKSFVTYWPKEIPILVQLDSDMLRDDVQRVLRPNFDGVICGWEQDHLDFVTRNKGKDDANNYRKQAVRFCHKVFALKGVLESINRAKADKMPDAPRYLIWLDADVLTTRQVTIDEIKKCLPKEGDAVSYMGRKDWDHSECGWLAFDLENGGGEIIEKMLNYYKSDEVFKLEQWHDSFVFDQVGHTKCTNLTPGATGMEVWPQSPMAAWSRHYKGPIAKQELVAPRQKMAPLVVQTRNSIPDESIQKNILHNQTQIKNWIRDCLPNDEEIVIVSAGPMLAAEDIREEVKAGRKIVAVKHVLEPLKKAGIKPWACILLDPREHMNKFVENPDTDILWLVASQVSPEAVKKLLDAGCNVVGYHAAVGANEDQFTMRQSDAIVHGGSATATRGLFVLEKLGFHRFRLYGYDLCVPDKPDLNAKDEHGQPKFFEISLEAKMPNYVMKRAFWSTGELIAQYNEFKDTIISKNWEIRAFGYGIAPFIADAKRISDLRHDDKKAKLGKPVTYEELLCNKKTPLLAVWRKLWPKTRRRPMRVSNY